MLELSDRELKYIIINMLKEQVKNGQHAWTNGDIQQRDGNCKSGNAKNIFLISETKIQWVNRKLNTTEERIH